MGAGLNPLPGVHLLRVSSQGGEQKSEGLSQVWLHLHDLMTTHMLAFQHMNHWGGDPNLHAPPPRAMGCDSSIGFYQHSPWQKIGISRSQFC